MCTKFYLPYTVPDLQALKAKIKDFAPLLGCTIHVCLFDVNLFMPIIDQRWAQLTLRTIHRHWYYICVVTKPEAIEGELLVIIISTCLACMIGARPPNLCRENFH